MPYNAKKKRNRRSNTSGMLDQLFGTRAKRPCAYCGRVLQRHQATFDHVRALSQGGYDKTRNGAIACGACNNAKGSLSREEFLKLRGKEGSQE